jgi:hypothetical protein
MFKWRVPLGVILILLALWVPHSPAEDNSTIRFSGSKYLSFYITDIAKYYVDNHPNANVTVGYAEHYSLG